jgi:hypothetical protein
MVAEVALDGHTSFKPENGGQQLQPSHHLHSFSSNYHPNHHHLDGYQHFIPGPKRGLFLGIGDDPLSLCTTTIISVVVLLQIRLFGYANGIFSSKVSWIFTGQAILMEHVQPPKSSTVSIR